MSPGPHIEITLTVPLPADVDFDTALRTAKTRARYAAFADGTELAGVAILADGRCLEIGEDKLREWTGSPRCR